MKRILPALTLVLLTGCQTLGLSDGGDKTAMAPPPTEAAAPIPGVPQPTVAVADAWAAPTAKGAKVAEGFLIVANGATADDRLLAASSPRAGRVEFHEVSGTGKTMKTLPVKDIVVPAGGSVALNDGAAHLLLKDLTAPFVVGDTVPVKLTFEKAGEVEVVVVVKKRAAQ